MFGRDGRIDMQHVDLDEPGPFSLYAYLCCAHLISGQSFIFSPSAGGFEKRKETDIIGETGSGNLAPEGVLPCTWHTSCMVDCTYGGTADSTYDGCKDQSNAISKAKNTHTQFAKLDHAGTTDE